MPAPPSSRRSGKSFEELTEVERAMAALEGRDVTKAADMAAARKDAERQRLALEKVAADTRQNVAARRLAIVKRVAIGLGVLVAGGFAASRAVPILKQRADERARADAAVQPQSDAFVRQGFAEVESANRPEPSVTLDSQAGRCFVVVAATSAGHATGVSVRRGARSESSSGSLGLCTCGSERLVLAAEGEGTIALRVLSAPARAIGGADLLAALSPAPTTVVPEPIDRECAEAAIDDWLAAHAPAPPASPRALGRGGFVEIASLAPRHPVLAVPAAKDSCFLAVSSHRTDALAVRVAKGGRKVSGVGCVGFCASDPTPLAVARDGDGEVTLYATSRDRAGGALGTRELARPECVDLVTWVPPEDRAADARATLVASGAATLLDGDAGIAAAQLFALSTDTAGAGLFDASPPASVCTKVGREVAICLEASAGAWKPSGTPPEAIVFAKLPGWLPFAPSAKTPPAALEAALGALATARALQAEGWELTTLAGVKETGDGAEVVGRSGETEIRALAVGNAAPYVHALVLAKNPEPVVPLAAGATVRLRAMPPYAGGRHEIVVWRR